MSVFVWHRLILGITCTLLLLAACASEEDDRPLVLATTPILADLAMQVAGDAVRVQSIMPADADPHTFDITPSLARRIGQARLIFANGLGLEGPLLEAVTANKAPDARLVEVGPVAAQRLGLEVPGAGVDGHPEEGHDHSGPEGDPHLWLDPGVAGQYVDVMAEEMAALDPANAEGYRQRARDYIRQLRDLDAEIERQLQQVPPQRRKLVTSHAAFHWLARRYGLAEVGYLVTTPEAEPGAGQVAALRQLLQQEGVPAVFTEPQLEGPDRLLARLAQDLGLRVCTLYSDAFDQRVRSYLDMMRHNGRELVRCLGGT
ncbi:MAG TPA: metal ABC transporter substrate-binding protein [Dehalococcoidia bacterium]|nr:metal ABC transporter substrate-binding protein [Dehalococcoidia bacterium]